MNDNLNLNNPRPSLSRCLLHFFQWRRRIFPQRFIQDRPDTDVLTDGGPFYFSSRGCFSLWNNQIGEEDSLSFVNLLAGDAASSRRRRRVWQVFSSDSKWFSGSFTHPPRHKKPHGGGGGGSSSVPSLRRMTMQPPPNRRIRLSRLPEAPALHSPSCLFSVCVNTSDAENSLERRERRSTLESKDTSVNL